MEDLDEYLREIENKKLLVVFPHPDDESFNAAGLIQRARKLGFVVHIITLTRGDRGKNHLKNKTNKSLSEIRFNELQAALEEIGFDELLVWNYLDGSLRTDKKWVEQLVQVLAKEKFGVVVTYDHSGLTGHPDHIALSVELFKFLKKSGGVRLLWASWPGLLRKFMINGQVVEFIEKPKLQLDLSNKEHDNKCRAIKAHQSQLGNLVWWQRILLKYFICAHEYFSIADFDKTYDHKFVDFKF